MRNLKLPNLDYKPMLDSLKTDQTKTIGYETKVRRDSDELAIIHHSSKIAQISRWSIWVDLHGYNSSTTVDRVSRILHDNNVPYSVAIRQGLATLINRDDKRTAVGPLRFARFEMVAGLWTLVSLNGTELER